MDDAIIFRGEGPCDDFLRGVRKAAFDKGKHKDGDWMAGYASTCFAGEALRWYEGLDDDVQDDWKQLRTAMLERFPPVSEKPPQSASEPSPASIPGSFIPTAPAAPPAAPAAAPPPAGHPESPSIIRPREIHASPPGAAPAAPPPPRPAPASGISLSDPFSALSLGASPTRRGRVAVIADSVSNRGWIAKSRISGYYEVTPDPNQALRVEYAPTPGGRPVDLRLLDSLPESNFDRLGIVWHVASPNIAARSSHNALCVAVRGPADEGMLSCNTGHSGPADTSVWSIKQDGTVDPVWSSDAQLYFGLQAVVYANKTTKRLLFVADWGTWLRRNRPNNYDKARLIFEPI